MINTIIKRDGREKPFEIEKIVTAITKAMKECNKENSRLAYDIALDMQSMEAKDNTLNIEEIQDEVENKLMDYNLKDVAKAYIKYREKRSITRQKNTELNKKIEDILRCKNIKNSNANIDEHSFNGRKFEASNELQKYIALNAFIRPEIAEAHKQNRVYIHDLSDYAIGDHNCTNINFKRTLGDGFSTRNGDVRKANSLSTAFQLMAVIFQCSSQNFFGGCASIHIDTDLAPYVDISFKKHLKTAMKIFEGSGDVKKTDNLKYDKDLLNFYNEFILNKDTKNQYYKALEYAITMTQKEAKQGAQALYHNLNTLESIGSAC